jgi:hypothetical protein
VRCVDALAVRFIEGEEDCESLQLVVQIEQAAARLHDAALRVCTATTDLGREASALLDARLLGGADRRRGRVGRVSLADGGCAMRFVTPPG